MGVSLDLAKQAAVFHVSAIATVIQQPGLVAAVGPAAAAGRTVGSHPDRLVLNHLKQEDVISSANWA